MTRAEVLVNLGREDELDVDGLRRLGGVDHQVNLEVDLLFFDTTSTYFERDEPDGAGEGGEPAFRAYGHSKDHRPDLPQVVIGLAVTRDGIPVRVWVWPGNTNACRSSRKSKTTSGAGDSGVW